jgi:hypothetical protein
VLLSRRASRQSLQKFTEATTPRWEAGKIHRIICEQFDRVARKEIDRLLLLCPPQHGKSTAASRRFPAFQLGNDPTRDVISASATAQLAEEFGRDVRDCIASQEYARIFPDTQLAEDSKARGRWNTKQGGGYYAVGIGGALMGRGGDLGIIDDPFATWADAQSETIRESVWSWYQGTFYNRIRPGGSIAVIQHRMHEDDLVGRLLAKQQTGGDKWEVVELPALLDDPPWPERYDRPALERIKANTDPRQWAALYQQNPTPEDGTYFQRSWFKFYDPEKVPEGNAYTTGDFAVTEGGGDFTELGTHIVDHNEDLYVIAGHWKGQTTADQWIERLCDQIVMFQPLCFFGEGGPIRRSIEPFLTKRMRERRAFCRMEWLPSISDKPTRARGIQARAAMGKVFLPDNDAGHALLAQLLSFPAGMRDDGVDMLSLMGQALDQSHAGIARRPVAVKKVDRWDRAFGNDYEDVDTWKTA